MSILIATSLIYAHPFKFAFCFGCLLVLALHLDNQRLLLCESPFSFDDIALYLAQLIVYRSRVHHDPRAAVPRTLESIFRPLLDLDQARAVRPCPECEAHDFQLSELLERSC
ncbi:MULTISPECIES: hypothetical protein [Bradyrhizobium]|uniref:hypothetical protein n=1 Tax=Bradyrhizobium TaxID=374 RepID=UPI001B8A3AF4|nr:MULTISPECIES: hypothetical protein [Bradyrhizobium]MBR0975226.1 hypothetical protein [Bradyrhizobium japonicum]